MYSIQQVSIFYLLLIALLAYVGFTQSIKLGSTVGVAIGDAVGGLLGALLGVFISYQLFLYVRRTNQLKL